MEDDDYNSEDDEANDFTVLRRQRFDGHGQDAADADDDEDDDFYADAEPFRLATPVAQRRVLGPQVSHHQVQTPTTPIHRSQVDVAPPHPRVVPNSRSQVPPPRTHVSQVEPPHIQSLPTTQIYSHRSQVAPPQVPGHPHRPQVPQPHIQNPLMVPHHPHRSQVASPHISSLPTAPSQPDRSDITAPRLQSPLTVQDCHRRSHAAPPRTHDFRIARPHAQNPQVVQHHSHEPQLIQDRTHAPAMALRRTYSPHGTQNCGSTPSHSPPRAHREIESSPQGPGIQHRAPIAGSPPSRPTSSRVNQPQAGVPDLTQLRAASNLLHLQAAAWSAVSQDTRPDPVLQADRQPLRATQPGNRGQVWVMYLLRTSLRRSFRFWTIHRSLYGLTGKEHEPKPWMRVMRKLTSWQKRLSWLQQRRVDKPARSGWPHPLLGSKMSSPPMSPLRPVPFHPCHLPLPGIHGE